MSGVPDVIHCWRMVNPTKKDRETGEVTPGKLERAEVPVPELKPGEVLVEVAGCGVCHTDLSYFYLGVPTVSAAPLTLGHEIAGTVVAGDDALVGKEVIIPAVMPCGECDMCKAGRGNRCLRQAMPGNSWGDWGGFASHIPVPARDLCLVPDHPEFDLAELAVVADAVTTPYQAAMRAGLEAGDPVLITGVGGGVGTYMLQVAKALGASPIVGIDVDQGKLDRALEYGADHVINTTGLNPKAVKGAFKALSKENRFPRWGWKIFEVSGVAPGQRTALDLLSFCGTLVVVGYTPAKSEYMLSKLMAFDAEIIGTWGCLPEYYNDVLAMVLDGRVQLKPFVQTRPMSTIAEAFEEGHHDPPLQRIVLVPDF